MLLNYIKQGTYTTFFYGINSLISRGVSFVFLPYLLSRLTLQEFGLWDFYQLFFSTGALIISTCPSASMIRFYIFYKDSKEKQRQSLGNALLLSLTLSVVFPVVLYGFNYFFPAVISFSHYLVITIISVSFFSLFTVFLAYIRMQEKLVLYTLFSVGQNLIAVAGTLIGLRYNWGIEAFFYANLVSYILFFPCILQILVNNNYYCFKIFKEQIVYSFPLLVYALMYTSLFSIDKLYIQNYLGYEALGLYGLLWRFGSVFQMVAIAMIDAWYIVLYNVQKEDNADHIIAKLIRYYSLALTSFALAIMGASVVAIRMVFPLKYHYCIQYVPFFFVPLVLIEIARLFQTAFGLSTKTLYMPFLTAATGALQLVLLHYCIPYGIWGVFLANTTAYLWYILSSYWISYYAYPHQLIDLQKIGLLFLLFILNVFAHYCFFIDHYFLLLSSTLVLWPLICWHIGLVDQHEKEWIALCSKKFMHRGLYFLSVKKNLLLKRNTSE